MDPFTSTCLSFRCLPRHSLVRASSTCRSKSLHHRVANFFQHHTNINFKSKCHRHGVRDKRHRGALGPHYRKDFMEGHPAHTTLETYQNLLQTSSRVSWRLARELMIERVQIRVGFMLVAGGECRDHSLHDDGPFP